MRDLQSRRSRLAGAFVVFAALCAMATAEPLAAQPICPPTSGAGNPPVLTGQNDNNRDAYNGNETCLYSTGSAPSVTLAEASFSPLLVDTPSGSGIAGYNPIYTQPLYVPNIAVQHPVQGTCSPSCDMLVIATAYGSIFAYNADNGYLLWSRTGTGGTATNWLWADDCQATGNVVGAVTPARNNYIGPGLPFAGIVSTPVIDTSPPTTSPQYTATMFLTSLCQTPSPANQPQWWLHEIDLAGLASGADVAGQDISKVQINPTSGSITFNAPNQLQRPALLEIKVPNAAPNPLIYVGLGVAGSEITAGNPYHGWLLGYTINSSSALVATPSLTFVATPTSCGTGGGIGSQCPPPGDSGTPPCDCLVNSPTYHNAPNWGGMGGGIWMSGRGPASRTDSNNLAHTFVATGNGGFQNSGATNWGDSILDFHLSSASMPTSPSDFFTPFGGPPDCWETNTCLPVIQPPLQDTSCAYDSPGDGTCNHTVEFYNEYDWDMGVSGITLFNDSSDDYFIVTVDKGGYGYLLLQDNMKGFQATDKGNRFPFQAVGTVCTGPAYTCHRTTSLAFYNNTLYLWPDQEVLRALHFYEGTQMAGSSAIYTDSITGATVTGSGFSASLIPGDFLIAQGYSCTPPACPTVTAVNSDTQVIVSPPFSPPIPSTAPVSYGYNGYFVNPIADTVPTAGQVGYPGGSVIVTSNNGASGTGVVWGLYAGAGSTETGSTVGPGYLDAYDAGTLSALWSTYNRSIFKMSRFALPTVAHGSLFIPTYNISTSQGTNHGAACSTTPCLGVLVYQGTTN